MTPGDLPPGDPRGPDLPTRDLSARALPVRDLPARDLRWGDLDWADLHWRTLLARLRRFWRVSLQFRTVAITVVLSSLAVSVIGAYISISIGDNLFSSRQEQVTTEAVRANLIAQQLFTGSLETEETNPVELSALGVSVREAVSSSTTSPGGTGIAIFRTPGQPSTPQFLQPTSSRDFPADVITEDLSAAVAATAGQVLLQSVQLPNGAPGLVAGSQLSVPSAGSYELYLVYDLSDAQTTLGFVQQTLFAGGLALVALIGGVTYIVVRLVVGPVRLAAATSQRLAAGDLEVRIPEKGEDVIATLARSFNGMADGLQQQITKLAELSRLQQRFVSDVSHELRTPLTTIRLAGDVLYDRREDFPPETARIAELLHTQVQRFEVLLSDLLEISRYDAGAVELDLEPTNLVRLVEDAVDAMGSLATERGSDLHVVAPGGYFEAEVDARRIRRILRNLLGNSIEHGEGRPIVVTVDSNATAVAIAVRDYGVGMTESEVAKVFDRFWRADPSRQRTIGGTGLGLAISLEDAVQHDGRLDVWSEPHVGTCFRLTLPRERGIPITTSPLDLPPEDRAEAVKSIDA
ncbi:MtrAB system histidine kinase MtrB [Marisediminicola senii]|uniref:MtrAB system histidine kinase MtrB n=1 Tax=Marisediminicola senii TaxID=2711233 RepID=UPI001EEF1286|nr:MtrAB system histidine kinase MtrB [Marisediminicola senii]